MEKSQLPSFELITMSIALFGAGCGDNGNAAPAIAFPQNQIQFGTFGSEECFLNKVETQATGQIRYSTAEFVFFPNGTGTAHYTLYAESNCGLSLGERNFTFNEILIQEIGGTAVLRLKDTGNATSPTGWFPVVLSTAGYTLDIDFTDGESGPYDLEPTPAQVSSFSASPAQGVLFTRL